MIQEIVDHNIEGRAKANEIGHLLRVWTSSQLNGRAPYAMFMPDSNRALGADMIVMHRSGSDDYIYTHFSKTYAMERGIDWAGLRLSHAQPNQFATDMKAICDRCLADGRPLLFFQRTDHDRSVTLWERFIMPCIDENNEDVIVILNKPCEYRIDLLHAMIEATPDGVLMTQLIRDSDGHIIDAQIKHVNRRAAQISAMEPEQMIGQRVRTIFPHMLDDAVWRTHVEIIHCQKPAKLELQITPNDKPIWLKHHLSPVGEQVLMVFSVVTKQKLIEVERLKHQKELEVANAALAHEITRRKALEDELRAIASLDPLTGLFNRRAVTEAMGKAMSQAERFGHGLAVIAIDLDHFKTINSRFGHGGGDEILKSVARIFSYGLREDIDIVGRMGGEEFLAVLPNTSLEGAVTITERLRRQFASFAVPYEGHKIRFTASFGVCAWTGRESMEDLSRRADAALMQAKSAGRNIVVVDTGEGNRVTLRRLADDPTDAALPTVDDVALAPDAVPAPVLPKKIKLKAPKKAR